MSDTKIFPRKVIADDMSFQCEKALLVETISKDLSGSDRLPPVKTNSHRITELVKNSWEGRLKRINRLKKIHAFEKTKRTAEFSFQSRKVCG